MEIDATAHCCFVDYISRIHGYYRSGEGSIHEQDVTLVYCDSQSAIHLAKHQAYHAKTKHIDVRYNFIGDC